jgi:hypothetical protein
MISILLPIGMPGQSLTAEDQKLLESARSRYYNLEERGFLSASCSVDFDFSTIPSIPVEDRDATYRLVKETRFTLNLDRKNPTVSFSYPMGASDSARRHADPLAGLLRSLVFGLFQTWPSKGLHGPVPAFSSQIESVERVEGGYKFVLKVPGGPVQIEMDKNYLVRRITSIGGKVEELPIFDSTPDGLIFAGNVATDDSEVGGRVQVRYEFANSMVDGFRLPSSVRLRVNQNIDVRYSLTDCSVQKGTVIRATAPEGVAP